MKKRYVFIFVLLFVALLPWLKPSAYADDSVLHIGVLSKRGDTITYQRWNPTAQYLSNAISGKKFDIVPLDFDSVEKAVADKEVDFILVNSSIYVTLEMKYGVGRIATMKNITSACKDETASCSTLFGGVIITKSGNDQIKTLQNLAGKRFAAVDENSLGGWDAAWYEMQKQGLDPYSDLKNLEFLGTHDAVVYAVLKGEADAGTIRTDTLERMEAEGKISLENFRIIHQQNSQRFPLKLSTELFPEWPFAKLQDTSNEIALKVAIALMQIPEGSQAARQGQIQGWTIPLDYLAVHQVLKELKIGPYAYLRDISIKDIIEAYWPWFIFGLLGFFLTWGVVYYHYRTKELVAQKAKEIKELNSLLESKVVERTQELEYERELQETVFKAEKNIVLVNNREHLLHANPSFFELMSEFETLDDFRSKHKCICEYFVKSDEPEYVFDGKEGLQSMEYVVQHKDAVHKVLIKREDGDYRFLINVEKMDYTKEDRYVVTLTDITELEENKLRLEERIQEEMHKVASQAQLMMQQSRYASMGEMLTMIAHHWRQPLSIIGVATQNLQDKYEFGELTEEEMNRFANQISLLITDLSEMINTFSRYMVKQKDQKPFDIVETTQQLCNMIRPELEIYFIDVKVEMTESAIVFGAPSDYAQIFQQLLKNAEEAVLINPNNNRKITLSLQKLSECEVLLSVEDNGKGLDENAQEHLFEPFFTTKEKSTKTGLGLYMVKLMVEQQFGGSISAENTAEGGVRFMVTIPMDDRKPESKKAFE